MSGERFHRRTHAALSPKGEPLARLGRQPAGLEPGQFISPHGLAVDSRSDIYAREVSFTNWALLRGPAVPAGAQEPAEVRQARLTCQRPGSAGQLNSAPQ